MTDNDDYDWDALLKKNEEAARELNALSARFSFEKGIDLYYNKGKDQEALDCFTKAIEMKPDYFQAYAERGNVRRFMGETEEAIKDIEESLRIQQNASAYFIKAKTLAYSDETKAAKECLALGKKLPVDDALGWLHKGGALSFFDRSLEVLICCDEAIKLDPKNMIGYYQKGKALNKLGRTEEALATLDKLIRLEPSYLHAYIEKGHILSDAGRDEEAITFYDKAIQLDAKDYFGYLNKGNALFRLGRNLEAIVCYDQVKQINPKDAGAFSAIGKNLAAMERHEEALDCYKRVTELEPKNSDAYFSQAIALQNIGRLDEAFDIFDKAIEIEPTYIMHKAVVIELHRGTAEARDCFDEAIRKDPTNVYLYCAKAAFVNEQNEEDALECLNKAFEISQAVDIVKNGTEIDPEFVNRAINEARPAMLKRLKKLQEVSIATRNIAQTLDPENEEAAIIIKQFDQLKKEQDHVTAQVIDDLHKSSKLVSGKQQGQQFADQTVEMARIEEKMLVLQRQMIQMQKFKESQVKQNTKVIQTLDRHENALQSDGVIARAQVAQGFKDLEKKDSELHNYCKTFYWTLTNLFGAYRSLSTGIIKGNVDYDVSTKEKLLMAGAQKAAKYGSEIAKGIPFVGGLIGSLDKIISSLYDSFKETRLENKVNAINRVIQSKFGMEEDISVGVGKLAITMTQVREKAILYPEIKSHTKFERGAKWLKMKIAEIKSTIMPAVELYNKESHAAVLALEDVTLLVTYLCKNHEAIVNRRAPLEEQSVDIIKYDGLDQMLENVGVNSGPVKREEVYEGGCLEQKGCNMFFVTGIIYDNPLLNNPDRLGVLASKYGMSNVLAASDCLLKKNG